MSAESDNTRAAAIDDRRSCGSRDLRIEARTAEDPPAKLIVDDVSLTLKRGKVLGLIGESGAGKSTIGLASMGYGRGGCSITGGEVLLNGATSARADRRAAPQAARPRGRLCRADRGGRLQPAHSA